MWRRFRTNTSFSGMTAASFGVVGAIAALQFLSDVPKVRTDICQVCTFLVALDVVFLEETCYYKGSNKTRQLGLLWRLELNIWDRNYLS